MNVSLTPSLEQFVRSKVKSGGYESASEVVRESLRALRERDNAADAFWVSICEKVRVARDDQAAGRVIDGEQAMAKTVADLGAGRGRTTRPKPGKR